MRAKIIYLILIITLFISGCEKTNPDITNVYKIGNTYNLTHDLSFTIDSINDSRCPPDAMCFWVGDVFLYLDINYNHSRIDTAMYLRNTSRNPIQIGDYSFKVLDVNPISGGTTTSKDIIIKMNITKN